jgi:hypothetical protein
MAHETSTGSSPIVKTLMNELRTILPEDQRPTLEGYAQRAEASQPEGDLKRARYCLNWAIETAESPKHSPLSGLAVRLKETHKAWQDIWLGAEFGFEVETGIGQPSQEVKGDQKIGPGEDVELLWVDEAIEVAKTAAAQSGWENVPWEQLLEQVLRIA